jgi:hypothetical protein
MTVKRENDEEALTYAQNILNEAQPKTPEDILLHRFVKGMYNENKYKFLSFIRNANFECLVLWTESRSIVQFLGLRGVAYIKWTGKETLYLISKFQSSSQVEGLNYRPNHVHPMVRSFEPSMKNLLTADAKGNSKSSECVQETVDAKDNSKSSECVQETVDDQGMTYSKVVSKKWSDINSD